MARPSPGGLYRLVAQQETRRAVDGGRQAAQSVGFDVAATPARRRHRRRRRRRRRRPIDGVDRRHQVAQLQLVQVGLPPVSQSARHRRVPNAKHFSLSTVPPKKNVPNWPCCLWPVEEQLDVSISSASFGSGQRRLVSRKCPKRSRKRFGNTGPGAGRTF